ncbi:MAG: phosphatidylserine synthase [Chlorobi bacterium]|nr:phosphatidylserine synthase [Chlorobiota bacterium]
MSDTLLASKLRNNLANFFTLLNLVAGLAALKFIFDGRYEAAFYAFLAGIFFDFIDGLVARATGSASDLGLQLDSLADLVTSGVVPGFFLYRLWSETLPPQSRDVALLALLIPVASAWRLAKFNVDPRQKDRFHGLPTPFNALVLWGIGLTILKEPDSSPARFFTRPEVAAAVSVFSALLLNADIPLLAFKSGGDPALKPYKYILVAVAAGAFLLFSYPALPFILVFYIALSWYVYKVRRL